MRDQLEGPETAELAGSIDTLAGALEFVRGFIRRHWALIALFTLPGVALALAFVSLVPWKYQATATLLIDKQRLHFFQQQAVVGDPALETNAAIEGQLEILKSDAIALAVIKKLGLDKDPEFAIAEPTAGTFSLFGRPAASLTQAQRERHHLDVFANLRTVRRLGASFAIEVGFQSHNAARAAQVANAVAEAYISDMWSSRRVASEGAVGWLQQRLSELRTQALDAENAVVDYKAKHGIIESGGKLIYSQQVAEIGTQLTQARSQLADAKARLARARAVAEEYATSPAVKPAMAETLNNTLTNKLIEQYLELSNRAAEYAERFGADHKATQKLQQRLEEAKSGLLAEMERVAQSFLSEKTVLERKVQDLEASLQAAVANSRTTEQAQVKLHELESVAQSYRALYDGFLRRHSEAVLQQEQPSTLARVISPASEPLSKNMKKPMLYAAVIAFGSFGLSLGLSFLRDLRDRTFRTGDDIERRLQSDFIGMIPRWEAEAEPALIDRALPARVENAADPDRHMQRSKSIFWAVALSPVSAFAEGIARVKYSILRQAGMKDDGIIGFTSVLPSEGASTTAAGVAQSMAKSGRNVILVDCDLRHPALTRGLAPHAKYGLQEVLLGEAELDDAILTDPQSGFAFLPGVAEMLRARPEELLEMEGLGRTLRELGRRYEYVIVDLPPLFPMLDVSITDRHINWYVVVVQWGSSKIDTVAHALARCTSVRNRMLGFVLNKVDMRRLSLYDQRTAEYYDRKRYANYVLPALPDYHTGRGRAENGASGRTA